MPYVFFLLKKYFWVKYESLYPITLNLSLSFTVYKQSENENSISVYVCDR